MHFVVSQNHGLPQKEREEHRLQSGVFPNQNTTLGSFSPHSTIVEVPCFNTDAIKATNNNLMSVRQGIQVLCHEMTHWFDFFGTMWGREYIGAICQAYIALEECHRSMAPESQFPKLVHLFDQDRKILSPDYYRFSKPPKHPHDASRPWSIEHVVGTEIDPFGNMLENKPIFMVKFGEHQSTDWFARQPISVGSLLEIRAIASEVNAAFTSVYSNPDRDAVLVERKIAEREFNSIIYNHELIEYNAAMHMLSVKSNSREPILSARLGAALAYIALNLSETHFKKLMIPDEFSIFDKRIVALTKD